MEKQGKNAKLGDIYSVFSMPKEKKRFFKMLELSLSSNKIPSTTVASFIKVLNHNNELEIVQSCSERDDWWSWRINKSGIYLLLSLQSH
jgi:hypothetical protein